MAVSQKQGNPKMACHGKWKRGLKCAVPGGLILNHTQMMKTLNELTPLLVLKNEHELIETHFEETTSTKHSISQRWLLT